MSKFTAGPWRYTSTHQCSNDAWFVIADADGWGPIFEVGGRDFNGQVAEAKYLITDREVIEANARLIAESPALYTILKRIINRATVPMSDGGIALDDVAEARAAIARVEG